MQLSICRICKLIDERGHATVTISGAVDRRDFFCRSGHLESTFHSFSRLDLEIWRFCDGNDNDRPGDLSPYILVG